MARIGLWVADHRKEDQQPVGSIIQPFPLGGDALGLEYADFRALHTVWSQDPDPPEIIGFFTHRKYLMPPMERRRPYIPVEPAHAYGWWQTSRIGFDRYRQWWSEWDGAELLPLLAQYDILQAPPFPLADGDIIQDFMHSRSEHDAGALLNIARRHGFGSVPRYRIYSYIFITRWSVFDRMMCETEPLRLELHGLCKAEDSANEEYKKRPMAYVMERVYSLWLEHSGLAIKEMPLLHCWEM